MLDVAKKKKKKTFIYLFIPMGIILEIDVQC